MAKMIEVLADAADREVMKQLLSSGNIAYKFAVRVQVVLKRAEGWHPTEVARFLDINVNRITQYVKAYNSLGLDGLVRNKSKKPGRARVSEEVKNKVCDIACHEKPPNETRWSTRLLAKRVGISHNKVSEILRERGIKPHIQSYYSFSEDPEFETKLRDVVGLYMNPPKNASET